MATTRDIVSLDVAHQILGTFGISGPTPAYERWIREDGFLLRDFREVLAGSRFVFIHDWRGALDEMLEPMAAALQELDAAIEFDVLDDEGTTATVTGENGSKTLRYDSSQGDGLDDVVIGLQSLVPATIEFRASPANDGSDTYECAVLLREEWQQLEAVDRELIRSLYVPLQGK
jgi:hypothetical protein